MQYPIFKEEMRHLILSQKNKPNLQAILSEMVELYVEKNYPLEYHLFKLQLYEGIPEGASVLKRKEVKPFKERGSNKSFTQLTLSHPDWEREYSEGVNFFSINTLIKWEYPSKVKEEAKRLGLS